MLLRASSTRSRAVGSSDILDAVSRRFARRSREPWISDRRRRLSPQRGKVLASSVRRDRLLLKPHGFEGFAAIGIDLVAHEQTVAERELLGAPSLQRQPARTTGLDRPAEDEHAL